MSCKDRILCIFRTWKLVQISHFNSC